MNANGLSLALALAVGCTSFRGRAADATTDGFDAPPSDAALPDAPLPDGLVVHGLVRVQTADSITPSVNDLALRFGASGALLVAASPEVRARRLFADGSPRDESLDLSLGAGATQPLRVAATPAGWMVFWGQGVAWVDASGAVTRRVSLRETLLRGMRPTETAVAWVNDRVVMVQAACTDAGCAIGRRELLPDGRVSAATTILQTTGAGGRAFVTLDARGGAVAIDTSTAIDSRVRLLGLTAQGALDGDDRALGPLRDERGNVFHVAALVLSDDGARTLLVGDFAELRVLRIDARGERLGPSIPFAEASRRPGLIATSAGLGLLAGDDRGHLRALALDRYGATVGPDVTLAAFNEFSLTVPAFAFDAAQNAWMVAIGELPSTAEPSPPAASTEITVRSVLPLGSARTAWTLAPSTPGLALRALLRDALTFLVGERQTQLVSADGAPLAIVGNLSAALARLAVDDELWSLVAIGSGLSLYRAPADGRVIVPSALRAELSGGVARVSLARTPQGAAYSFENAYQRLDREGNPLAPPVVVRAGDAPVRLFAASDGAILWVELSEAGMELKAFDAHDRAVFPAFASLDGAPAPEALGGWSCGPACWLMVTTTGVWRVDATGVSPQPAALPKGVTALAAAAQGDVALIAMRLDDGAALARLRADGSRAIEWIWNAPVRAENGLGLVPIADGRFLLAVGGTDPADPGRPGIFDVLIEVR